MSNRKIPPAARDEILARLATGETQEKVTAWANKKFSLAVTRQAIAKLAKGTRLARADIAKATLREGVAPALVGDLAVLDREIRRLRRLAKATFDKAIAFPAESRSFLDVDRSLREALAFRAKLSGADEGDGGLAQTLEDLLGPYL